MHQLILSAFIAALAISVHAGENTVNELSYQAYVDSTKRIKCFYGYAADKSGDHVTAIQIFEDCIRRWNDVYSMISLALIYEMGVGVERDIEKATLLLKRGAESDDEAGYSSLARYHYGIALYEGRGILKNEKKAVYWLQRADQEGVAEAGEYLRTINTVMSSD